ncbi:unnamed protein product [Adineta ricciae]|uniref:Uncharacterized protein n=2 Tax=Adineta ricciae TaxID=249248 RepID=A0A813V7W2_ADIRI|nr:unnamed protein product [Adineta ricciae]
MSKRQAPKLSSVNAEPSSEDVFKKLNIRYRVCTKFSRKRYEIFSSWLSTYEMISDDERDTCKCNRPMSAHDEKDLGETSWDMHQNTVEKLDPVHGVLPNGALFTRLAIDTPKVKVERLFSHFWCMSEPRLIMSIIGGAKYFTLSERLESNFINGIIDVALKSDTWLITNGYNVGIVQLVGQAINKVKLTKLNRHITAIGLCKWGSIKDVEVLTSSQATRKQSKNQMAINDASKDDDKKRERGQRDLELNHSHYLMLDDGRYRFYDTGDYRTKLCAHLAKLQHEYQPPIPVVTIVVEGGQDTIANIYYDLRENIPVVIIDGSGRVADFFKSCLLYTKEFDEEDKYSDIAYEIEEISGVSTDATKVTMQQHYDERTGKTNGRTHVTVELDKSRNTLEGNFEKFAERLKKDLAALLSHENESAKRKSKSNKDDKGLNTTLRQVMYCLQPAVRSGLSVFNLNSDNDLSETIFRSICKAQQKYFERREMEESDVMDMRHRKLQPPPTPETIQRHTTATNHVHRRDQSAQRSDLLLLAMDWDCIDVAKELILQNSIDNILNKEEAFRYALSQNLPTFVYEFLKLGVNPSEIFFPRETFFTGRNRYGKMIECLYKIDKETNDQTHLSSFIEASDDAEKFIHKTDDLNELLATLVGDYMHKLYFDTREEELQHRRSWGLVDNATETNSMSVYIVENEENYASAACKELVNDYVMRDLFIWAILVNHTDIAKVFLSHMKYRICAALVATKILKQYYDRAAHGDLKDGYANSIDYFQSYAIACINQCEKNDPDLACEIVLQRIELYGNASCLQVAADAGDKLFIASSCCVQAMQNIWYNKVHPDQSRKRNEVAMTIGFFSFGLLAPFLVNFRKVSKSQKDQHITRTLQPYGINYPDPYPLEHPRYCKIPPVNTYLHNVKNFYQSLRVKYCCHCLVYCFFLLLFSYVLLFDFQPPTNSIPSIDWTEILTIIFVSIMLIEEVHYFIGQDSLTILGKCRSYFQSLFKIMTLLGFVLFYIGLILRFTVVMAFDLEIWWLRSLSFIIVVPFLGPHLVAIGKMLKDLLFFMCIIAIVMTGYGVASRSMVYYSNADLFPSENIDTSFDGRSIFRQIAYPVYYLMYGQFGNELSDLDANRNAGWSISTHVLLAAHMLFVNILLTNLLIAMFSKRFDQVYEDTQNIWHSQQYIFTREYYTRSPFFPPISLFYDMYYLCRIAFFAIRRKCFKGKVGDRRAKVFKMIPVNKEVERRWYQFEGASTYEYAHAEVKAAKISSTISTSGSDSTKSEKKDDATDNNAANTDANNPANNMRQIRDYLATVNDTLELMKTQLKILSEEKSRQ